MRHYEVIYLVHPDQSEHVTTMREKYRSLIEGEGGVIHRDENIGRRQLAYPIAKAHKAHYLLMNIECEPNTLKKLVESFNLNKGAVLRHLVVARDEAITEPSALLKERDQKKDTRLSGGGYRHNSERREGEPKPEGTTPDQQEQIAS